MKSNNLLSCMLRAEAKKREEVSTRDIHGFMKKAQAINAKLIRSLNGWRLVKNKKVLYFKNSEDLSYYFQFGWKRP